MKVTVNWDKIKPLMLDAVKSCGSYEPLAVVGQFEEHLTSLEYETVCLFLKWVSVGKDNRAFGCGNLDTRIAEFWKAV